MSSLSGSNKAKGSSQWSEARGVEGLIKAVNDQNITQLKQELAKKPALGLLYQDGLTILEQAIRKSLKGHHLQAQGASDNRAVSEPGLGVVKTLIDYYLKEDPDNNHAWATDAMDQAILANPRVVPLLLKTGLPEKAHPGSFKRWFLGALNRGHRDALHELCGLPNAKKLIETPRFGNVPPMVEETLLSAIDGVRQSVEVSLLMISDLMELGVDINKPMVFCNDNIPLLIGMGYCREEDLKSEMIFWCQALIDMGADPKRCNAKGRDFIALGLEYLEDGFLTQDDMNQLYAITASIEKAAIEEGMVEAKRASLGVKKVALRV